MNDHAGWTPEGLCVACGADYSGDPCNSTPEKLLERLEDYYKAWKRATEEVEELHLKVDALNDKLGLAIPHSIH